MSNQIQAGGYKASFAPDGRVLISYNHQVIMSLDQGDVLDLHYILRRCILVMHEKDRDVSGPIPTSDTRE